MDSIQKRLAEIEKKVNSDLWVDVVYNDGTQKRLKFLNVLSLYIESYNPPPIKNISFIGDTENWGILPELLLFLVNE